MPQLDEIFEQLVDNASEGDPLALRDLAIIELLYASGLRVSELVGLNIGDVDLDRLTVRVMGKGSKERVVPFGIPAASAITDYLTRSRKILVEGKPATTAFFVGARGGKLSTRAVYGLVASLLEPLGGSGPAGPHALRHTAATHLLDETCVSCRRWVTPAWARLRFIRTFYGATDVELPASAPRCHLLLETAVSVIREAVLRSRNEHVVASGAISGERRETKAAQSR
jgi:integrase